MAKKSRSYLIILLSVAFLLLPFAAGQFTDEFNWTVSDFITAAVLLVITCLTINIIISKVKSKKYRIMLCIAVLMVLFLSWIDLAVGIFGQ